MIIEKNQAGIRVDKFLAKEFFSPRKTASRGKYTRGEIIRQIKEGNILVNSKKIKPRYILKENDKLEINLKKSASELIPNKNIELEIIFKDENVIAVNKPAGLQVHPDDHEKNNTLANALIAKFSEIKNVGEEPTRPGVVHRLDKNTSGIIVIARNQKTFLELKDKFKNREVEKKYWAVVYGKIDGSGIIDKPMARSMNYRKQVVAGRKTKTIIREAVTHYKVLKNWDNFSLVEVSPKTGRMHQIRVHLTFISHPIVGDKKYRLKSIKPDIIAKRHLLHAKSIKFELGGKKYFFEAGLPEDIEKFIG